MVRLNPWAGEMIVGGMSKTLRMVCTEPYRHFQSRHAQDGRYPAQVTADTGSGGMYIELYAPAVTPTVVHT